MTHEFESYVALLEFIPTYPKFQVANAASVNASAVLIYPDPADYSFDEGAALFGHVSTYNR